MSHTANLRGAIARIAKDKDAISMSFQKAQKIDSRHSRVLVQVPTAQHARLSNENMAVAVASELNGLTYLNDSVHRASNDDATLLGLFVVNPQKSIAMEQASANGLSQVSDTVYQDANDDVWSVIGGGDTAYLVKAQEEDIDGLLAAVKMRAMATASMGTSLAEDFSGGMVLSFYDLDHSEKAFGIAVDGGRVFVPGRNEVKSVDPVQVIAVIDNFALNIDAEKAAVDIGKAELIEYMTLLYGNNAEMLTEIKRIINEMY
jgi:hypothetical protein